MQSNYCLDAIAPSADSYVFETGEVQQLLNLGGTIPIVYQQETYNIPVKVCRCYNQHGDLTPLSSAGVAAAGLPRHPALLLHPAHQGHGALGVPLPRPLRSV